LSVARNAALSFSIASSGVPRGAYSPRQAVKVKLDRPFP